jgi:hypothetical protein
MLSLTFAKCSSTGRSVEFYKTSKCCILIIRQKFALREMLSGDDGAHFCLRIGAGPIVRARRRRPAQGYGYAVMNFGPGSGGWIIHTEMMQGFRPSGATSEQLTSNF